MANDRERPSARKKLELRRESLRVLSSEELTQVVGGQKHVPAPIQHITGACHTTQ